MSACATTTVMKSQFLCLHCISSPILTKPVPDSLQISWTDLFYSINIFAYSSRSLHISECGGGGGRMVHAQVCLETSAHVSITSTLPTEPATHSLETNSSMRRDGHLCRKFPQGIFPEVASRGDRRSGVPQWGSPFPSPSIVALSGH